jgi:hypothetical protein
MLRITTPKSGEARGRGAADRSATVVTCHAYVAGAVLGAVGAGHWDES